MKLKISVAFVWLLLAHPAAAQSVKMLAREYIALPAVQDTLIDVQSAAFLNHFIEANLPPGAKMSPAKKAAIPKVADRQLAKMRPATEKALIDAAARAYTAKELEALIAFPKTDVGASATRNGAIFAQQFSAAIVPATQRAYATMRPEIMKILLE